MYYVKPTEPSNSSCPADILCQTLEHYLCNGERYLSSDKINVTMILLHGKHVLSTRYTNCKGELFPDNGYFVHDLETFEMIGIEPAYNVMVYLSTSMWLVNVTISHFKTLSFFNSSKSEDGNAGILTLPGYEVRNVRQYSQSTFVTVFNGTNFNRVIINHYAIRAINFSLVVINSTFTNQAGIIGVSKVDLNFKTVKYIRQFKVVHCNFRESSIYLNYMNVNISIDNSMFNDGILTAIYLLYSNIVIGGKLIFNHSIGFGHTVDIEEKILFFFTNTTLIGDIAFSNNGRTPFSAYFSTIIFSGSISFVNNTGINGGAMALYSSTVNIASNASVYFLNNTATETGGAIYVSSDPYDRYKDVYTLNLMPCFYQLLGYNKSNSTWYDIQFVNNSAKNGGDHIYGESMHSTVCNVASVGFDVGPLVIPTYCAQKYFTYFPKSISSVSSDPTRVCICGNDSQPHCSVFYDNIKVHPGETFILPLAIVGADLGTTIGAVHAIFENQNMLRPTNQYIQEIRDKLCTNLPYTIFTRNRHEAMYLTTREESLLDIKADFRNRSDFTIYDCLNGRNTHDLITQQLLYTPLLISITLLPCPPGFTLLGDPPGCGCYPVLTENNVLCFLMNRTAYHAWNSSMWLNIDTDSTVFIAQYCPFDYCNTSTKTVNFQYDSDTQCTFNRAGKLCGGCKKNYSLAIGSSHCIHCPNNNNLALLIFFAIAGFLLVCFIGAFNFTVTQGMINSLIFYANIIWIYQSILFSQQVKSNYFLVFLRILIAWVNLDLGIQTCFVTRLNAYWKTWLQYLFPIYIWSIAGVIIIGARHSTKLTKLFGNRAVSILATLFLLSYTKLFQTIIASVGFTPIRVVTNHSSKSHLLTVWSLDGNYVYCKFPHVLLFIVAILFFILIWLPYTLLLFNMQWLRKKSDLKLLKWVSKFNPVYDAYFAPLKHNHHYWFGVLLVARGTLLVIFTTTFSVYPKINYILLLMTSALLLCFVNYHRVYKNKLVQLNENFFILLLVLIGRTGILEEQARSIVTYTTIAMGFVGFCGAVIANKIFLICCGKTCDTKRCFIPNEQKRVKQEISDNARFQDSIFDKIEPLLCVTD